MQHNRTYFLILGMLVVISFTVGIVGNIAVNQIPDTLQPYLWVAWPTLGFLLVLTILLTIYQNHLESKIPTSDTVVVAKGTESEKKYDLPPRSNKTFEYDVFISSSPEDHDWVEQELIPRLEAIGSKIYDPREFSGLNRLNVIEEATYKCRRALLVISESYFDDEWGQLGNQLFQYMDPSSLKRRIIPIIIEKCELPPRLDQIIPVEFTNPKDNEKVWARLLEVVKHSLEGESSTAISSVADLDQDVEIEVSDPPTKIQLNHIIDKLRYLIEGQNSYPKAVVISEKFKPLFQKFGTEPKIGLINTWYGHALMYTGQTDKAIKLFQNEIIEKLKDLPLSLEDADFEYWCEALGRSHNHLGYINWIDLGRLEIAIREIYKAIQYFLKSPEAFNDQLATAYDNLGRIYSQLGYSTRAELLIEHGLQLRRSDVQRLPLSIDSLANAYLNSGQPNRAWAFSNEAHRQFLEYYKLTGKGERRVGLALLTKGRAYRRLGSLDYTFDINKKLEFEYNLDQLAKSEEMLLAAKDSFNIVEEKIRLFYVENELACVYRERAKLYKEMGRSDDCRSATLDAEVHIENSLDYLRGTDNENDWRYQLHYLDSCEDIARAWFTQGNERKANEWVSKALDQIPSEYLIDLASGITQEDISNLLLQELSQQIGKIYALRGEMTIRRKRDWKKAVKFYMESMVYFSLLRMGKNQDSEAIFPSDRPQLASHQLLMAKLYRELANFNATELYELKTQILQEMNHKNSVEVILLHDFTEVLNLICHVSIPDDISPQD